MKKFAKVLILLLSVALILGAVVMSVNADEKAVDLGKDITEQVNAGGKITLSGNSYLPAEVVLTKSLEIDLNGYTLSSVGNMFRIDTAVNLTVVGNGVINLGGKFVVSDATDAALTVNVEGTSGRGVVIDGAPSTTIVSASVGTYNFKNVRVSSTAEYDAGNAEFFDNNAHEVGAVWNFTNVNFNCKTAAKATMPSAGSIDAGSYVIEVSGTSGKANVVNSKISNSGSIFKLDSAKQDPNVTVISVEGSTLEADPVSAAIRGYAFYAGVNLTASGKIVVTDSKVAASYAIIQSANAGASKEKTDNLSLVAVDSVLRHYGTKNDTQDRGMISGNPNVTLKGSSSIITLNTEKIVLNSGKLVMELGTRVNAGFDKQSNLAFIDEQGNELKKDTVALLYDPLGNTESPYVAALADAPANNYGTVKDYETYETIHPALNDTAYNRYLATGSYDYHYSIVSGVAIGSTQNGLYGVSDNTLWNAYPAQWMNGYWWNIDGNFSVVKTVDNSYLKYYVPESSDPSVTAYERPSGAKPNLSLAYSETPITSAEVYVVDISVATDSDRMIPGELEVGARGSGDNGGAGININADCTVSAPANSSNMGTVTLAKSGVNKLSLNKNGWNHITAVCYLDLKTEETYDGVMYVFVNGELFYSISHIVNNNANASTNLKGWRFNATDSKPVAGSSILFDNEMTRAYEHCAFGEDASDIGTHNPNKYLLLAEPKADRYTKPAVATVDGVEYYTLNDALVAENDSDFDIVLSANTSEVVVVDKATAIWTNGYKVNFLPGSTAAASVFNVNGELVGYTLDPDYDKYTITYGYYQGTPEMLNDLEALKDPANYKFATYAAGQIPSYDFSWTSRVIKYEGDQAVYEVPQGGWGKVTGTIGDEGISRVDNVPVSLNDAKEFASLEVDFIPLMPVYVEPTPFASSYSMIIVTKDGFLRDKRTEAGGLYEGHVSNTKIGLRYGETLIFNTNVEFNGTFNSQKRDFTLPEAERTLNIDLNGHTLTYDPTKGGTDVGNMFYIQSGDIFNLYSSFEGGLIQMKGASWKTNVEEAFATSGNLFYVTLNSSDAQNATNAIEASKHTSAYRTIINVGDCIDYLGNAQNGKNLTVVTESFVQAIVAGASSSINLSGATVVRGSGSRPLFKAEYFGGSLNITNAKIINLIDGYIFSSDQKAYTDSAYVTANINVNDSVIIGKGNGDDLISSDYGFEKVTFNNVVTNGTINDPSNNPNSIIVIGDGTEAYAYANTVTFTDGVKLAEYNTKIDAKYAETYPYVTKCNYKSTDNGNHQFTFTYSDYSFGTDSGDTVLPVIARKATSEVVDVTYKGIGNNAPVTEQYAKGAKLDLSARSAEDCILNVLKLTHDGTWSGLPADGVVTGDITLIPGYKAVSIMAGYMVNLTLSSDLGINLYIPAVYKDAISSVMNGDEVLVISEPFMAENNVEYVKVTVANNLAKINSSVKFVINLADGDYEADVSLTVSVTDYAAEVLEDSENAKYTAEEQTLIKYMVKYIDAANKYFGISNSKLAALVTEIGGEEKSYEAITDANLAELTKIFKEATLDLNGAYVAFKFVVADGYTGTTLTIGGKEFTVAAGESVIVDVPVYELKNALTVTDGTVSATYSLENFAAYHVSANTNVKLTALIDALYEYANAAYNYVNP